MRTIPVTLKQAAFGLPFYAAWNFAAEIEHAEGRSAKLRWGICAVPVIALATVLWLAPWFALAQIIPRLMGEGHAVP